MKRWIFRILALLALSIITILVYGRWIVERQGAPIAAAANASAKVESDAYGVPLIRAVDWNDAVEAQGFTIASERMFQMDLIRRFAAGRLSELFGAAAIEQDSKRRREDWIGVAERAALGLDDAERSYCEAYAAGVNRFISTRPARWGVEYELLDVEPEPWKCVDTLLVLMSMAEQLTGTGESDAARGAWKDALGPEWFNFLFTQDHPWNEPLFGTKPRSGPELPIEKSLPEAPLNADEGREAVPQTAAPPGRVSLEVSDEVHGSNNWAWCGETGCYLANDPHLGYGVPQTWFAIRFELSENRWAAGVSLPGIPGIVLGMNSYLAWAFTNVGEDVDDLLIEKLSPDGKSYLSSAEPEVWKPVRTVTSTIMIKGGATKVIEARFTERGPIEDRPHIGISARRWLVFEPGMLRLPYGISRAKNWEELNTALDQMRAPAQNVLMIDTQGNVGYRASGTGLVRAADGQTPQPAIGGNWRGFEPPSERPRKLLAASSTTSRFIATANERIFVSPWGHGWADDARVSRIRQVLGSSDRLRQEDMYALQLDTHSRFHKQLLEWIVPRAKAENAAEEATLAHWKNFSGVAKDDPTTFKQALAVEAALEAILIGRVKKHLAPGAPPYKHRLARAWMLAALETPDGTKVFGVTERELAQRLLSIAARTPAEPSYAQENAWIAQHPFADRVPIFGDMFRVASPPQFGSRHVPRVEGPKFGASVRMVWNLRDPKASRWSFPVGQSGHVGSDHFDDARSDWYEEKFRPVFVDSPKPSR